MSKRIDELIKECTREWSKFHFQYGYTMKTHFNKEKFAELIIRECAVIANETLDPLDDYLIGNDILKHFGVLDE